MKGKLLWMWMLLLIVAISSCEYDDSDLWNKVNSLDERVSNIEKSLSKMNKDISTMSVMINALENNIFVSEVVETKDVSGKVIGYVIKFSDGTTATIANGKDGENGKDGVDGTDGKDGENGKDGADGKDAPVIGVKKDSDGKYYWTQTIDGVTIWLSDDAGNKLPVSGVDAVTPLLKVNASGYWMISYDNGLTYQNVLDELGNPVKAVGRDGNNGAPGHNGDSFFRDVEVEDGVLILTLMDGTEIRLPMVNEDLPEYIVLNQNLGDQVDYAILGLDGSGFFYEFQDENPNIPKRLSIYNNNEGKIDLVINFNNEGLPQNILSEAFTIVLGNYIDNKCDAVILTKEGESAIFNDVTIDYSWDDYKNGLLIQTRAAVSNSTIKWVNAIVGAAGCGLSIAATIVSAPTGVGAVVSWGLASISCSGAIMGIADAAEWIDIPEGSAITNTVIGHYANLASCVQVNNPLSVAACLVGLANNVTSIADLVFSANEDDINLGEGSLVSGNGDIKITLTWDNYSDIDLHCVDPSGYHIYYADKVSTTGGFLDYDNVVAYGPENIYFSPAVEGAYHVYLHYYAEKNGVNSVNYKVAIYNNGIGKIYEGNISGQGAVVDIATILFGSISNNTKSISSYNIDWNDLPLKKYGE